MIIWFWLRDHVTPEWSLVVVTLALTIYTARLWSSTKSLASDTARAAEEQAALTRAALELSRQEFVAANRPQLRVRHFLLLDGNKITFTIANRGSTVAKDLHVRSRYRAVRYNPEERSSEPPPFDERTVDVLAPGESIEITYDAPGIYAHGMLALKHRREEFTFTGTIAYLDSRGVKRQAGFDRRLDSDTGAFRAILDSDGEYEE